MDIKFFLRISAIDTTPARHPEDTSRDVLRLAIPAFVTLIAEPAFLLADSAIVGRLGTVPLAGLGIAAAALSTIAGTFVFLAYGTTAEVSRRAGAGDLPAAWGLGVAGLWLALIIGLIGAGALAAAAHPVADIFEASGPATAQAVTYLQISALGLPGMLIILAASGVMRGVKDTRTPLIVAAVGFTLNIALNVVLVFGFALGIAGSAWGTVIAQTTMAVTLVAVTVRSTRRHGGSLRPHPWRILLAARQGGPLLVRTLALRAVLLLTTWAAASSGDVTLAAYQVSATVWMFLAFAMDALAIAAQTLTGHALGASDVQRLRKTVALMIRWGVLCSIPLGVGLIALHQLLPPLFTADPLVQSALGAALLVVAIQQPLSAVVFVLDGVLIGAGDGRWLAGAAVIQLLAYLPITFILQAGSSTATSLWWGFGIFMLIRCGLLGWRTRGNTWVVTGVPR